MEVVKEHVLSTQSGDTLEQGAEVWARSRDVSAESARWCGKAAQHLGSLPRAWTTLRSEDATRVHGPGTPRARAKRACASSSSVLSRVGSLHEERSKGGTSFSEGGGDDGRMRLVGGATESVMCVGERARALWSVAPSGNWWLQMPYSG